jgi:hypothetical protein
MRTVVTAALQRQYLQTEHILWIFEIMCFVKMNKIYTIQYSDIHKYNTKGKRDLYVQLCSTTHCKKSVINMGIKTHNLPSELKRTENCPVFKNKLHSYLLQNCFYSLQDFLVIMIDGSFVIRVSLDMIWEYIDGLWTVYFHSTCDALFYLADLCFCGSSTFYCFIWNCWELSSMVGKPQQGLTDYKGIVLFIVFVYCFVHF